MARQFFPGTYLDAGDATSGYDIPRGERVSAPQPDPVGGEAPTAPPTQPPSPGVEAQPGPAETPGQGQGGPPPTPPAAPPAIPSAVKGIEQGEGGLLKGTFAGPSADFARRFGGVGPALWFRNAAQAGAAAGLPGQGRDDRARANVGRLQAGEIGGNVGGAVAQNVPAPSMGSEQGGANDEEWQRFMRSVMQNRFGGG